MLRTQFIKVAIAFIYLFLSIQLKAQITKDIEIEQAHIKAMCNFNSFKTLHIGYYGVSENCTHYYIYAFKYKKTWLLVANQNDNITFLISNPPRKEKHALTQGSTFLLEGLSLTYLNGYTRFKNKKKEEKEIDIRGFYRVNKKGRKAIKGMLLLEFPKQKIKEERELIWPFSMFKKKAEEVQSQSKESISNKATETIDAAVKPLNSAQEAVKIQ